jgi:peptide deformylase
MLTILKHPDARLRTVAQAVEPSEITEPGFQALVEDMLATMYASHGIGLAATQVDVHKRLLVVDVSEERNAPLVLINPTLLGHSGQRAFQEGCLSVPGARALVTRADRVEVAFLDRQGVPARITADGLLATCIQHEMDHLQGRLFIDHLSGLRREQVRRQQQRAARQQSRQN